MLENMDVSFRDQTLENKRIKFEILDLKKRNDYMPIPIDPRKKCHNCGNTNNLAIYCGTNKDINFVAPKSRV